MPPLAQACSIDDVEEVNEELALLTAGLDDIDIGDLLAQVRDIRGILDRR